MNENPFNGVQTMTLPSGDEVEFCFTLFDMVKIEAEAGCTIETALERFGEGEIKMLALLVKHGLNDPKMSSDRLLKTPGVPLMELRETVAAAISAAVHGPEWQRIMAENVQVLADGEDTKKN